MVINKATPTNTRRCHVLRRLVQLMVLAFVFTTTKQWLTSSLGPARSGPAASQVRTPLHATNHGKLGRDNAVLAALLRLYLIFSNAFPRLPKSQRQQQLILTGRAPAAVRARAQHPLWSAKVPSWLQSTPPKKTWTSSKKRSQPLVQSVSTLVT